MSPASFRFALVAAITAVAGCAAQLPAPTEVEAHLAAEQWPGTSVAMLGHGRQLYIDHCSGCHVLYQPTARSAASWPHTVDEMAEHAKLDHDDAELVKRYLVSVSLRGSSANATLAGAVLTPGARR